MFPESTGDIADAIRQFVLSQYLQGESAASLRDDMPLLTSGILDSLASVSLIAFLEERYAIELDVYDTSIERFDRIPQIAATVARKTAARGERPTVRVP